MVDGEVFGAFVIDNHLAPHLYSLILYILLLIVDAKS